MLEPLSPPRAKARPRPSPHPPSIPKAGAAIKPGDFGNRSYRADAPRGSAVEGLRVSFVG